MIPRIVSRLTVLAVLGVSLQSCSSCGDPSDPTQTGTHALNVTLHNKDSQAVHLFFAATNETFPCCRLDPNEIRTEHLQGINNVVVKAGRNGQEISTITCKLTNTEVNNGQKTITWLGGSSGSWMCS